VHTIGFGWLIGLDVVSRVARPSRSQSSDAAVQYDVVLVLRKPGALEEFMKPKVSLGVEFSVAAGPVGNGAMLEGGPNGAACWSYTKSKGADRAYRVLNLR
jgi:lipid-binding SYLF domain-containing protein